MKRFILALLSCLAASSASAFPINYHPTLQDNTTVQGEITPLEFFNGTWLAQYYRFYTDGAQQVNVTGTRLDPGYDMAFWVLGGVFHNTDQLGFFFDGSDSSFVAFSDDEIDRPGPAGDPQFTATLSAGWYTLAVTNFASAGHGGNDWMFDYSLAVSGLMASAPPVEEVPEPASIALIGLGLLGLAFVRRASR